MDIYDICGEAKYGDIEKATRELIDSMVDIGIEEFDYSAVIKKLIANGGEGLYNDEELKRIAVVNFVDDFVKNHREEIESNYNLLPLTNDNELTGTIKKIRDGEIHNVTDKAVKRPGSIVETEIKEQTSSLFDKKMDGYIAEYTRDVQEGEAKLQSNPGDAEIKRGLDSDKESLSVLKAFDQNKDELKASISDINMKGHKEGYVDYLSEMYDDDVPEYKQQIDGKVSKVNVSMEDVQSQLESYPAWKKVTAKVPSDELYELMGAVLLKKTGQTR